MHMYARTMKNVVALIGSASTSSTNHILIEYIRLESRDIFRLTVYDRLKTLPHFNPEQSLGHAPPEITELRNLIQDADGVIIDFRSTYSAYPRG